jgi:hypothetical protein
MVIFLCLSALFHKEIMIMQNRYANKKNRCAKEKLLHTVLCISAYKFSHPFEPPVEASTSFYVGVLAQKATWLGRFLDPGW